jgi:hypothetical protein
VSNKIRQSCNDRAWQKKCAVASIRWRYDTLPVVSQWRVAWSNNERRLVCARCKRTSILRQGSRP